MTIDVPSPCIKICALDPSGQVCIGCFRTLDEIGRWPQLSNAARAQVLAKLPERRRNYDLSALERCAGCGARFACGAQDATRPCWCTAYPAVVPCAADARCLCPSCLAAAAS